MLSLSPSGFCAIPSRIRRYEPEFDGFFRACSSRWAVNYTWRDGLSLVIPCVLGIFGIAWWFLYPRRFDARIRSHAKKQMAESSYAKTLGAYEVRLLNEHLQSTSPTGSSTYSWTAVDRVSMDSDYLFIFLSGPLGYPIRIAEIGQDVAQRAHDFVAERIKLTRQ